MMVLEQLQDALEHAYAKDPCQGADAVRVLSLSSAIPALFGHAAGRPYAERITSAILGILFKCGDFDNYCRTLEVVSSLDVPAAIDYLIHDDVAYLATSLLSKLTGGAILAEIEPTYYGRISLALQGKFFNDHVDHELLLQMADAGWARGPNDNSTQ